MYREHCIICVQFTLLCDQHNFSEPEFVGYVLWCNNFYICVANDVGIFIASYIFCDQYVYSNGDSSVNCILNRKKLTLKKGKSFKLKVTITPKDSQDKISYKTSNKKIATVSKNGKIKAKKKGTAKITVISGKKKAVCKVKVK